MKRIPKERETPNMVRLKIKIIFVTEMTGNEDSGPDFLHTFL